jgi:hypothetical protein
VNFELAAPFLEFALALGLTFLLLVVLYILNQITRQLIARRAIWFRLVQLPGTVIHECSHLLACWILLVPVTEFQPFSLDLRKPPGWVKHRQVDPIRHTLIALAPFIGGSLALLVITRFAFPAFYAVDWIQGLHASAPGDLLPSFVHTGQFVGDLLIHADYLDWRTWLFLYLVFAIGLQVAPSSEDFQALPRGLALVVGMMGSCYLLGLILHIDWTTLPIVTDSLMFLTGLLMILNRIFAYSAVLISLALIPLAPLAWLLARLRG